MKLRILGNSIRFRLTKSEIECIANDIEVSEICRFSSRSKLTYTIAASDEVDAIHVEYQAYDILVLIPEDMAMAWTKGNDVGMSFSLDNGTSDRLEVLIEKDFKCLVDRPEEDESDLFENPSSQ